ncbi:Tkl protein kinase, partial [Globisporangium polare]
LEAATGRPPWGTMSDVVVRYHVLKKGALPLRPAEKLSAPHWTLIEMMCASDASKRLTISAVVNKIQEIMQQQAAAVYLVKTTEEPQPEPPSDTL